MNISKGICNYCEQNESNDIEHINPKSFFPEMILFGKTTFLHVSSVIQGTNWINVLYLTSMVTLNF